MKKQIAVIIISLLAAMPAAAHQNNNNTVCIRPETHKDKCHRQCDFIWEDYDFFKDFCFDFCDKPCTDSTPVIPEKPVIPEAPIVPDEPVIPETPVVPDEPIIPEKPIVPDEPETDNGTQTLPQKSEIAVLLGLVNEARGKSGMMALTYDASLEKCANVRAVEIKSLFSHTRPNGLGCFTVLDENGYDYSHAGENIAYGQKDANEVFTAWMNSSGHRENILSPSFTKIGMGLYDTGTLYWSQFFAG